MIKLWLKENDIPALTSFAGNIDSDSLKPFIFIAQTGDLKAILGVELYNKINTEYIANTLTGVYATIYNEYVIYMLAYFSCSHYIAMNSSKVSNNGIITPEQRADMKEIDRLSARYNSLANNVLVTFEDYMKTIDIPEYKKGCENKRTTNVIGWY